jgi:hypothetical protein
VPNGAPPQPVPAGDGAALTIQLPAGLASAPMGLAVVGGDGVSQSDAELLVGKGRDGWLGATPGAVHPTEVEFGGVSDPSAPEIAEVVGSAVGARIGGWRSVRSRRLAESAVVRAVVLVLGEEPGRLLLWGSDDQKDPILRAQVSDSDGQILATVRVAHGRVMVEARVDAGRAGADPGALQRVEERVRDLVGIPSPIATVESPAAAAELATFAAAATAHLVAGQGGRYTVRVAKTVWKCVLRPLSVQRR